MEQEIKKKNQKTYIIIMKKHHKHKPNQILQINQFFFNS